MKRLLLLVAVAIPTMDLLAATKSPTLAAPATIADAGFKNIRARAAQGAEVGPVVVSCSVCARDNAMAIEADCGEVQIEGVAASSTLTAAANACLAAWKTAKGY